MKAVFESGNPILAIKKILGVSFSQVHGVNIDAKSTEYKILGMGAFFGVKINAK